MEHRQNRPNWSVILDHSSPMTTARYTHLTDFTKKDSLTTINALINTLHVDLENPSVLMHNGGLYRVVTGVAHNARTI